MKTPEATAPTPKPRTAAPNSDRRGLTNARAAAATSSGTDDAGGARSAGEPDAEVEGSGAASESPGSASSSSGSTVRSMPRNAPSESRWTCSAAASRGATTTRFSGTDAVDAGAAAALAGRGDAADDATHAARAKPRARPRAGSVAGGASSLDALARGRASDAAGTGRLGATDDEGRRRRARARAIRGDPTLARAETLVADAMTTARVAARERGVVSPAGRKEAVLWSVMHASSREPTTNAAPSQRQRNTRVC